VWHRLKELLKGATERKESLRKQVQDTADDLESILKTSKAQKENTAQAAIEATELMKRN
jgi:hypothetical protein